MKEVLLFFFLIIAISGAARGVAGSIDRLTAAVIIISEQHKPTREPGL